MEPLLNQLRELPKALAALPAGIKFVVFVAALAAIGLGVYNAVQGAEAYQYAFTNLTPEDSAEAAGTLKNAGVPFRLEAGGSALAVPAGKVYDARLLLAGAGLPRGGGVGFEIFDRGDLGVSEFTQKVNLRRATEGELARTISKLTQVRTARVHLTMPEKGLFRDQDKTASAAVVVNLQPGRVLGEKEIAGVRHLVSAAVPGLAAEGVTVVDGKGEVLTAEGGWGQAMGYQKKLEHDLEMRVVDMLEQAVGPGAVIARVTATMDANEVQTSAETVDPDTTALRSERKVSQASQGTSGGAPAGGAVAGAAANQPLSPNGPVATSTRGTSSTSEDSIRNFEVSKTTTTTLSKVPRLQKISVAVLVDGQNGQPRAQAELDKLSELARRAVGFDEARGDEFDLTSAPFTKSDEVAGEAAPAAPAAKPWWMWAAGGAGLLLVLALVGFLALRKKPGAASGNDMQFITPGSSIAQIEAALAREAALPPSSVLPRPALADPAQSLRDRARELASKDPTRAAHILKAWMAQEQQRQAAPRSHDA